MARILSRRLRDMQARRSRLTQAALSASLVFSPLALHAQGTTATVSGTVTDPSGAVIPNAAVTLKNQASGDVRAGKSNGAGDFTFSAVPVGTYEVDIQSPGFQTFQTNGLELHPGDALSLHELKLTAGSEAQTVNVAGATENITLDSGEQSSLISSQQIQRLSVEGRDVTELLKILPGFAVTTRGGGGLNTAYDPSQVSVTGGLGYYSGNGQNISSTALLSDGADITDPGNFGDSIQNVNYEQVSEVKVQTASFTADQARGPIVINAIGKSGGDHLHGSIYTYARTTQLNSADWLANYTAQAKPPDRQVYPGFTLGGPILIPGLDFNKSKKLTFFTGAEYYAQRNAYAYGSAGAAILSTLVPTAGMRNGDFSQAQLNQYLGDSVNSSTFANINKVPLTGKNGAPLTNGNLAGNIDPQTQVLLNTLPLPNIASVGGSNYTITNLTQNNLWQARGRVDYDINERNKLFIVYSKEAGKAGFPQVPYYSPRGALGGVNTPGGLLSTVNSEIGSLNYTAIITPSLTNEFYLSGAWLLQNFTPGNFAATTANGLYTTPGLFANGSKAIPQFQDYGNDGLPLGLFPDGSYGGIYAKKWVRTGGDNLTKVLGKHTVRIGFFTQLDTNHQVAPFVNTNGAIQLYYFPETITDPKAGLVHWTGAVGSGNGGNYLANFLEGGVFNYNQTNIDATPNVYFWNIDGYAQDAWRITPHLTVDLGVRFDHLSPWSDAHKQGLPVWDPAAYASRSNPTLPGIEWHAINPNVPLSGVPAVWAYVEPRVGFAWDAYGTGKTVVRSGFGIYRSHDSFNDVTGGISTVLGARTANANNILLSSVNSTAATATAPGGFIPNTSANALLAGDDQIPQVYTYNFAVDQKAPFNSIFEIAYIGNATRHLLNDGQGLLNNINAIRPGVLYGPNPTTGKTLPLFPTAGSTNTPTAANSVTNLGSNEIDQYRPYPLYHNLNISQHNAYANYNSLQMQWNKQQGAFNYGVNYTFSKALGVLGAGPVGESNAGSAIDPFNYANDYLPESFDRTHIFNATYSYNVGRVFTNRLAAGAANGWLISGITNLQSGTNLIASNNSNFNLGGNLQVIDGAGQPQSLPVNSISFLGTPDVTLQPVVGRNAGIGTLPHQYANNAAFSLPQVGQQGTYRPPYIHSPAFTNTDLTAAKDFHATEHAVAQLRVAAFNFINHANSTFATSVPGQQNALNLNYNNGTVNQPVATAIATAPNTNAATFGQAPLRTGRRILELSLKLSF